MSMSAQATPMVSTDRARCRELARRVVEFYRDEQNVAAYEQWKKGSGKK